MSKPRVKITHGPAPRTRERQTLGTVREGQTVVDTRGGFVTVGGKCDTNAGHWYCVTHREPFANQLQKDIHIHTGKHVLGWVCHTHGIEVP